MPFTIAKVDASGRYRAEQQTHVHYANVDTGAQVSCVSSALLHAFPRLRGYYRASEAGVVGIGGPARTLGRLHNVPLHIGTGPVEPAAVVRTSFFVLDNDRSY